MRVIVADDKVMGDALVADFEKHGLEVIGLARTKPQLLRLVDANLPDIVTLDLEMPLLDTDVKPDIRAGLESAREIRAHHPSVALLAFSQHEVVPVAEELISLGPSVGYQLKERIGDMRELLECMRALVAGDVRIDKGLIAALVARKRIDDPVEKLTPREREVLQWIAEGLTNAAIADKLHITEGAVEGHETSIYRKLGLSHLSAGKNRKPMVNVRVMAVLTFLKSGRAGQ